MKKSRMNLPKGPDALCFDKDEFLKVRAGSRGRWPVCLSLLGILGLLLLGPGPLTPRISPRRDLAAFAVSLLASGGPGQPAVRRLTHDEYRVLRGSVSTDVRDVAGDHILQQGRGHGPPPPRLVPLLCHPWSFQMSRLLK